MTRVRALAVALLIAAALVPAVPVSAGTGAFAVPGRLGLRSPLAPVAPAPISRPKTVWKPIPFGPKRRSQTARYSKRHYGLRTWQLTGPNVIVEHYTGSDSFLSAWYTFAGDRPFMGELPGVCAQFIIDRNGTIYQLTSLDTMCRHTIGLNWTAIGIEHVGTSDAQVLHDRRQMLASLHLTVWLMQRYRISIGNVIGHSESIYASYYREHVASFRCVNHSDWSHRHMTVYRRRASRIAKRRGVALGAPYQPVDNGC